MNKHSNFSQVKSVCVIAAITLLCLAALSACSKKSNQQIADIQDIIKKAAESAGAEDGDGFKYGHTSKDEQASEKARASKDGHGSGDAHVSEDAQTSGDAQDADTAPISGDKSGSSIVDAILYNQSAAGLKRNQEAGYFVEHDGRIYYRLPKAEAMQTSALFGNYMNVYCGPSEIRCYDPAAKKSEKLYDSVGCGKMYVLGNCIVAQEGDGFVKIPFDGSAPSGFENPGTEILAIYDHYMIYEDADYDKGRFTICCRDLLRNTTVELGNLKTFEGNYYAGELQQFYAEGNRIWFTMAEFQGTGRFYYSALLYQADITRESSLTSCSIGEIEPLPEADIPEDLSGNYNRAPAFVIRDGKPYLTAGEPATAELDYGTGELAYYDPDGNRTPVGNGFETFESEEEDTVVSIELTEYVGGRIFLIRNEQWRDPANDVGWREAYVRKFTYIVMVDPQTGEETIMDAR